MLPLNTYFTPPSSPDRRGNCNFSPTKTNDTSFSSYLGASYPSDTTSSDKVITFSQKIANFLYWDATTSSTRSPLQNSPSKLVEQRSKKINALNQEKTTLLRACESEPALAACVERLAKKASLPHPSAIFYGRLPTNTQTSVNETVDILLQVEQVQKNITSTLTYRSPLKDDTRKNAAIDRCIEGSLLLAGNSEDLENALKRLPQQTNHSLAPLVKSTISRSEYMSRTLIDITTDRIQSLPPTPTRKHR